jgi:hypothetical protein
MVALVLGALILAACTSTSHSPTGLGAPPGGGSSSGGSDSSGSGGGGFGGGGMGMSGSLVGVWQNVFLVSVANDVQRITTTLQLSPDGSCLKRVETFSFAEGFPRITQQVCRWELSGTTLLMDFGGGFTPFMVSFQSFDPNRLVVDGIVYTRIG